MLMLKKFKTFFVSLLHRIIYQGPSPGLEVAMNQILILLSSSFVKSVTGTG
jgi:hypothetical protein